jgi:hypothetical protein
MESKCFRVTVVPYWRREPTRVFGLPGPQDSFSLVAASPDTLPRQNASAASPEVLFALRHLHDVTGGILE